MIIYERGEGFFLRPSDSSTSGWTVWEDGTCEYGEAAGEPEVTGLDHASVLGVLDRGIRKAKSEYLTLLWDDLLVGNMSDRLDRLRGMRADIERMTSLRGLLIAEYMKVIPAWDGVVVEDTLSGKQYLVELRAVEYTDVETSGIRADEALGRVLGEATS